jgi:hypothetical protein
MAKTLSTQETTTKRSLARMEIFTDPQLAEADYRIVIHCADTDYKPDGSIRGEPIFGTQRIERRLGDLADDSDIPALMAAIKTKGYQWMDEDEQRAAAAAKAAKAADEEFNQGATS